MCCTSNITKFYEENQELVDFAFPAEHTRHSSQLRRLEHVLESADELGISFVEEKLKGIGYAVRHESFEDYYIRKEKEAESFTPILSIFQNIRDIFNAASPTPERSMHA